MSSPQLVFHHNPCVCGADEGKVLFRAIDSNFNATNADSAILRCPACGSLYPERFPDSESLAAAYANYYTANISRRGALSRLADLGRDKYLSREAPDVGSILDYGCGSGAYLNARAEAHTAAKLYGSDVYPGREGGAFTWLDMTELTGRKFHHITLSHVLEHVPDPVELFRELAALLEDDGTLWIATPNAQSFLIDIFGPYARDVDFPRHRAVLSRTELERAARAAGLSVTWRRSPLLNTLINTAQSARNVWNAPATTWKRRAVMSWRTVTGTLGWIAQSSDASQQRAPETVAICRKISAPA